MPATPTREVHTAFISPVLPLKGNAHHASERRSALLLPPGSPVDSKVSVAAPVHVGAALGSWSHLSESMLELDRALESPLFPLSPASRAPTPPPRPPSSTPPIFSRDKDTSLLKMILIPREPSPKHATFDVEVSKPGDNQQWDNTDSHALELPSLLFDQTLKYIRSSARSALTAFDAQAAPAASVPSAPASGALFHTDSIGIYPLHQPTALHLAQECAAPSDSMSISDLTFPAGSAAAPPLPSSSPHRQKQLIDPFMCVSSHGLAQLLAAARNRRLVFSCWRFWQLFVVASGNARVLKLEAQLQQLQSSFSSLQAKYSLVCSSEFSKRISTEHLRWSAAEFSAGAPTALASKSSGNSNPVVSRFERIMFKARMSLRVRTSLRCFRSWFMLANRHRQLRSCYNFVSRRRTRRLLSSVVFSWYRGAHMQSRCRLLYSNRQESDDDRQLQSQLARQDKMIDSLRDTNRKLELDLRRMVRAPPFPSSLETS